MAKEILISEYRVFNDRGSVSSNLIKTIEINASEIVKSKVLSQWSYSASPPVVEYYDGESIELSFEGKVFQTKARASAIRLFSAVVPNDYVNESVDVYFRLKSFSNVACSDYAAMFRHASFNALVYNALPVLNDNPEAAKYFIEVFVSCENIFLIDKARINTVKSYAINGNKYACFAYGYYHLNVHPDMKSPDIADYFIRRAYEKELPEAAVAIGIMYRYGDLDKVDRYWSNKFFNIGLEKDCEFALQIHIKDMIFGRFGVAVDLPKAIEMLDDLIDKDRENAKWRQMRGWALQQNHSLSLAKDDYEFAAKNGIVSAWSDYVVASSYNDDDELIDKDAYVRLVVEGSENRDCLCRFLLALHKVENYDDMSDCQKAIERKTLMESLEDAYKIGSKEAAVYIGDIYYYGWYDIPEDNAKAYSWYAKAALLKDPEAFEKMFYMIKNGYINEDLNFMDNCALNAARLGSEKMLKETVIAYLHGRLKKYYLEIEQYYMPVFDSMKEDAEDDDDYPDDDGRYDAYV